MHTVAEILGEKDAAVIEIDGGATVFDAVKAMVQANVGALLVTDGETSPASLPSATTCVGSPSRADARETLSSAT